jgi:hypothetical protein
MEVQVQRIVDHSRVKLQLQVQRIVAPSRRGINIVSDGFYLR